MQGSVLLSAGHEQHALLNYNFQSSTNSRNLLTGQLILTNI